MGKASAELREQILEFVRTKPPTVEFIISSALKADRKLVRGAIRTLIKEGKLEEFRAGDSQSRCYRIKGT
jgi:predicted transcriptional regulator